MIAKRRMHGVSFCQEECNCSRPMEIPETYYNMHAHSGLCAPFIASGALHNNG